MAQKIILNPDFLSLLPMNLELSFKRCNGRTCNEFHSKLNLLFTKKGTSGIRTPVISLMEAFVSDVIEREVASFIVNYNSPGATGAPAFSAL